MPPPCLLVCISSYCIDMYLQIVTCSRPRSSTVIPGPTAYLYLCSMPSICIVLYTYSDALQTRDTGSAFRFLAINTAPYAKTLSTLLCNQNATRLLLCSATKMQRDCHKTATKLPQNCTNLQQQCDVFTSEDPCQNNTSC